MMKKEFDKIHQKHLIYIANFIREYRYSIGLSQFELSQKSSLHRNSIQRVEKGYNISLLTLFEICDCLDISLNELFQEME